MRSATTEAEALMDGAGDGVARLASKLLKPLRNNFVERPWGGMQIRAFKGLAPLADQHAISGMGLGEAFEIAAFDDDDEASQHPSLLRMDDGSVVSVPALLARHAEVLLGRDFVREFGSSIPLLPKTLDVRELLSVQGHPEGNTEVYIVIAAEPGATLRLGFSEDIDAASFKRALLEGRQQQEAILGMLGSDQDPAEFQAIVAPWLAAREEKIDVIAESVSDRPDRGEILELLNSLKSLYWRVLDSMNAIPVEAGQVIYNANPERISAAVGKPPSAEVHALGNPEGKEILALEVRRPGPTFRAWDNVRFPIREIDVEAAIDALNLKRTAPEEFLVTPTAVDDRDGVFLSVDSPAFRVEHLRPSRSVVIDIAAEPSHCLHAIRGNARFFNESGNPIGALAQGESAIVPVGVGAYRVESDAVACEIVKVSLPVEQK